jgi:exodeoxyribonuclease-1
MAKTFFFYDLETSGLDPRNDRIMQFAGIRTDMELNPIGEPYNILVELANDTLPSPRAVLVTGITPQKTREEGYSEADFARLLAEEVFTADTITVGFNNVRFDDEFIRYLFWRTFRDPYEWAWREGRSRWDLLDVVRITRALRPNGIKWPVDKDGKAVNKLELLTRENGLSHEKAHDALSDVEALIAVTALIKSKQPKLFSYLLKMRDKKLVQELVNLENKQPFVYCSGRYQAEFEKTTVAIPLTTGRHGNVVVYDLRYSPADFAELSVKDLSANIFADSQARRAKSYQPVPIKELVYNKCPAVAPVGVLEELNGWVRIGLDEQTDLKTL